MDFSDLLKQGAELIQSNSDDATTNLDIDSISNALGNIFGGENGLDLSSIISKVTDGDWADTISSWLGSDENKPISMDSITDLLGSDKISEFASSLGLSEESAKKALSEVVPDLVDKASNGEDSLFGNILEKVGGVDGAMDMIGKMFKS